MKNYEAAEKDYKKFITYKEIAKKYGVSIETVKSWRKRHGWKRSKTKPKPKKKIGAPFGNNNALGNKGGPPIGSQNALKHGLFAKYLPLDMISVIEEIETISPIEILWGNICIKYAAIIRAQKIMFIENESADKQIESVTQTVEESDKFGNTKRIEKHVDTITADIRMEKFLKAQSRAMDTLTKMIKQYDELCRSELATEEQKARIDKLKNEVTVIKQQNEHNKMLVPIIVGGDLIED
ncbi:phage terminase small subunit [Veillonella montpellierensis]|uniref:phage terminase small subunit n=1 Tax=Veillonella montpellierensis TaxID=187328 RepID=UPI0004045B34|nr:phage terminase small subunit [Veillonella montpellierensis]